MRSPQVRLLCSAKKYGDEVRGAVDGPGAELDVFRELCAVPSSMRLAILV